MSATARLRKELVAFKKNAPPGIRAQPQEDNILRWHYVVEGPKDSDYEGGFYHGEIKFPPRYPFKPPSIWMTTPSGRFEPGARICMSFTDYHPESWNPAWSSSTILAGLLSFMVENERTAGSIIRSGKERRRLARQSLRWNVDNNPKFRKYFPDLVQLAHQQKEEQRAAGVDEEPTDSTVRVGWEFIVVGVVIVVMAIYGALKDL